MSGIMLSVFLLAVLRLWLTPAQHLAFMVFHSTLGLAALALLRLVGLGIPAEGITVLVAALGGLPGVLILAGLALWPV